MAKGSAAQALDADSKSDPPEADRVRRLVDADFDFVWRNLRRMGLCPADADDASQEVFVVASRRLGDIAPGSERGFLFGIALRVASTQRRRAARRPESLDSASQSHADAGPSPEDVCERRSARRTLDEILDELDLDQRAVFVLYELEQLSVPEIAELLGIPIGTVASRLRRARAAFCEAVKRLRAREGFKWRQP
jgi:RNA polymerase sigma-70 factor, ECF subfamily